MKRVIVAFIVGWIAVAVMASAARAADGQRDDSASEKLGIKLLLQCWTYNRLTLFETIDEAANLGVKYLEIYPGQKIRAGAEAKTSLEMTDEVVEEVRKKLAAAGGLKLIGFGVAPIPPTENEARQTFERAKKLGIAVLVTETPPNEVHDKLCKEFNIRMALHNHPTTWPPAKIIEACKGHCHLIGACCDTGHWMTDKLVPVEAIKTLEGRVMHSHFKDRNEFGKGHDVVWGTGVGNPKQMLTEMKRQGFRGYCSIEYEHGSLSDLAENLPKCVRFFDLTMAELAKQ